MPELASIEASTDPDGYEAVEIVSPDRFAAMMRTISALAMLSVPPTP